MTTSPPITEAQRNLVIYLLRRAFARYAEAKRQQQTPTKPTQVSK